MIYSDRATEILKSAKFFGMDGTFKKAPKIFYQIFTIIAMYKSDNFPCVFMLLEKKVYETYLEAMVELRNNLIRALCLNLEPSLVHFHQETMRHEYNEFTLYV